MQGCHRLRGRRAGSTLYLDVHIEVDFPVLHFLLLAWKFSVGLTNMVQCFSYKVFYLLLLLGRLIRSVV